MVKKRDTEYLKQTVFDCDISGNQIKSNFNSFNLLHQLDHSCQTLERTSPAASYVLPETIREKQVEACYALLNTKDSSSRKLLLKILDEISNYVKLSLAETTLVYDIWKSGGKYEKPSRFCFLNTLFSDVSNELLPYLLSKFRFIYEKPLLTICTSILQTKNKKWVSDNQNGEFEKIVEVSKRDEKVKRKIESMLCELYLISSCDELSCVINKFE